MDFKDNENKGAISHTASNEDISLGEVTDAAVWSSWSVLHAEVQVEPVSQLDLKTHSDGVISLLAGDVQDETTEDIQETYTNTV